MRRRALGNTRGELELQAGGRRRSCDTGAAAEGWTVCAAPCSSLQAVCCRRAGPRRRRPRAHRHHRTRTALRGEAPTPRQRARRGHHRDLSLLRCCRVRQRQGLRTQAARPRRARSRAPTARESHDGHMCREVLCARCSSSCVTRQRGKPPVSLAPCRAAAAWGRTAQAAPCRGSAASCGAPCAAAGLAAAGSRAARAAPGSACAHGGGQLGYALCLGRRDCRRDDPHELRARPFDDDACTAAVRRPMPSPPPPTNPSSAPA